MNRKDAHGRGENRLVKPRVFTDEKTGREIRRVSPEGCANTSNYFYNQSFTPDESRLLYNSNRSGTTQVCSVHIDSGETRQITGLTPDESDHIRWNIHPNGRELFIHDSRRIRAIDLETLEERQIFDAADCDWIPEGVGVGGYPRFSPDGRWVSFAYTHDPQECLSPAVWSHYGVVKYNRSGIGIAACDGSGAEPIYRHIEGMQHLTFCSGDPNLMSFAVWPDYQNNNDLAHNHRARAWLVDRSARIARPYLVLPHGFRATHEYWSHCGRRLYYHWRVTRGIYEQSSWKPCGISYIDRATSAHVEVCRTKSAMLGHSIDIPGGRRIVSDDDDFSGQNALYLIDIATGKMEPLWYANVADGAPGMIHGGPTAGPQGGRIAYTSDFTGEPQVYIIELEQ